jgi:hypothetical protein
MSRPERASFEGHGTSVRRQETANMANEAGQSPLEIAERTFKPTDTWYVMAASSMKFTDEPTFHTTSGQLPLSGKMRWVDGNDGADPSTRYRSLIQ